MGFNEKLTRRVLAVTLGGIFFATQFALAADWTYQQNFEGLNLGDLNAQDSWANLNAPNFNNFDVVNSDSYGGNQSAKGHDYFSYQRNFSSIDTGTFYVAFSCSEPTAGVDGCTIVLRNATTYSFVVKGVSSGGSVQLKYYSNGSYVNFATISPNTWNVLGVQLDLTNHQYKLQLNETGWTGWLTTGSAGNTNADRLQISQDNGTSYWDDFSLTYPVLGGPAPATDVVNFDVTSTIMMTTAGAFYGMFAGMIFAMVAVVANFFKRR